MNHARSAKKRTGGRRRNVRKKRKHEIGSSPTETQVGEHKLKVVETQGGNTKVRAIKADTASVATDDGVTSATIEDVVENPSNPNYVRRNIITKGPGQDGLVNAELIED